jgi:hypothetical protein
MEGNPKELDACKENPVEDQDPQLSDAHPEQEDESQEESGEEMEIEIPKTAPTTKAGRKTNKAKREKATTQDKDLGTQPTLEEILRKEEKNGKAHPTKGQTHPSKGGSKHNSK